jgi:CheY-like chemotaxis protein
MSKKLLLADDSITIQKVIGITFANEDYELTVVDNGDTALERTREIHPDLVLADVFMPGRNGYELCAAIKQDPALCHIPVLLLTGTFEPFDEEKARRASADSWISKPFESQNLIDRVEELLSAAPTPAAPPAAAAAPIPVEVPEPAAAAPDLSPAAEEAPAEGVWGDLDLEAPAPAAAAAIPPLEEDPWGSIAFDEADLQPTAPELEEEFIFEDEELLGEAEPSAPPIAEPAPEIFAAPEPPPPASAPELGEADWGDFEEEILPLDESDILEAEELVEGEEEAFLFAAEEEAPTAGQGSAEEEFIFEEEAAVSELQEDLEMDALFAEEPAAPATGEAVETEDFFAEESETTPAAVSEDWDLSAEAAAPTEPVAEKWDFDLVEPSAAPSLSAAPEVPTTPAAAQAPAAAAVAVEEQVAAFSEADLERIVERVAGAIVERLANSLLEKVVWDVVPDMAESLIREEIRKITGKTA